MGRHQHTLGSDIQRGGYGQYKEGVGTLRANGGDLSHGSETLVTAHTLRDEGFDASEDGTGRGTPNAPVAFSAKDYGADATNDLCPTLRAGNHDTSHANSGNWMAVAFQSKASHTNSMNPSEISPTLDVGKSDGIAVAFAQNSRDEVRYIGGDGQIVGALAAEPGMMQQSYIAQAVSLRGREGGGTAELDPAIRTGGGGGQPPACMTHMTVRRLTPTECARLQGFPDDHAQVPYRNKPAADGPMYKAYGNSMAVNVMSWIGMRIEKVCNK